MSPYEKIRAACIKANPEIVELKFGCAIKVLPEKANIGDAILEKFRAQTFQMGEMRFYCGNGWFDIKTFWELQDKGAVEILGRPIRLADILLALHEKNPNLMNKSWVVVGANGIFFEVYNHTLMLKKVEWDLTKDDLSLQPLPTQEFIASLL